MDSQKPSLGLMHMNLNIFIYTQINLLLNLNSTGIRFHLAFSYWFLTQRLKIYQKMIETSDFGWFNMNQRLIPVCASVFEVWMLSLTHQRMFTRCGKNVSLNILPASNYGPDSAVFYSFLCFLCWAIWCSTSATVINYCTFLMYI